LSNADGTVVLAVNGEIYNYVQLKEELGNKYKYKTKSDCEVILYLWEEFGTDLVKKLDGMYSFVLYDSRTNEYFACRDNIGITTLYQGWRSSDSSVWFASEMKALNEDCDRVIAFPPGHFYTSKTKETVQYYNPVWYGDIERGLPRMEEEAKIQSKAEDEAMYLSIRNGLEEAVRKRLMAEVPYGVLLSGGLDSSLIASIAMRMRHSRANSDTIKGSCILCRRC
jgi:asparagine synthase (glutamine-hydrolysing)